MKTILHFQIPITASGQIVLMPDIISKFMKLTKESLGEDYIVIASPCVPSLSTDAVNFYNFDINQLNVEELISLIEKNKDA
jgi:hypothetical protein